MQSVFLGPVAAVLLLVLVAPAEAQQSTGYIPRVGLLVMVERPKLIAAFRQKLRQLGYVEGKTLIVDYRSAEGNTKRLPALAREMAARKPDVIVTHSSPGVRAVKNATTTIPIVMATVGNAVELGFVKSIARPDKNITGNSNFGGELAVKRVGVLKEVLPSMSRMALLAHPTYPKTSLRKAETAVRSSGVEVQLYFADGPKAIDRSFAAMRREGVEALQVLGSAIFYANRGVLIEAAARNRIPVIYPWIAAPEGGGLISYGPSLPALFSRAAVFVDKILKGARPADLPVEQPTVFELVINLRTARALGVTIPRALLLRADEVIE